MPTLELRCHFQWRIELARGTLRFINDLRLTDDRFVVVGVGVVVVGATRQGAIQSIVSKTSSRMMDDCENSQYSHTLEILRDASSVFH